MQPLAVMWRTIYNARALLHQQMLNSSMQDGICHRSPAGIRVPTRLSRSQEKIPDQPAREIKRFMAPFGHKPFNFSSWLYYFAGFCRFRGLPQSTNHAIIYNNRTCRDSHPLRGRGNSPSTFFFPIRIILSLGEEYGRAIPSPPERVAVPTIPKTIKIRTTHATI